MTWYSRYWRGYGPATWWCKCNCSHCYPTRMTRDIWGAHCLYCEAIKFKIVEQIVPDCNQSKIEDWVGDVY